MERRIGENKTRGETAYPRQASYILAGSARCLVRFAGSKNVLTQPGFAGGFRAHAQGESIAELYDPSTGAFAATAV